jgi:hypothetical protein
MGVKEGRGIWQSNPCRALVVGLVTPGMLGPPKNVGGSPRPIAAALHVHASQAAALRAGGAAERHHTRHSLKPRVQGHCLPASLTCHGCRAAGTCCCCCCRCCCCSGGLLLAPGTVRPAYPGGHCTTSRSPLVCFYFFSASLFAFSSRGAAGAARGRPSLTVASCYGIGCPVYTAFENLVCYLYQNTRISRLEGRGAVERLASGFAPEESGNRSMTTAFSGVQPVVIFS